MNVLTEHDQALATWRRALRRDWTAHPWSMIKKLARCDPQTELNMTFRRAHDKIGWMAKGTERSGGLCSGALYRTTRFIKESKRTGKRVDQTVHIEHTVPVSALVTRWIDFMKGRTQISNDEVYAWLFVHSVTTAFHNEEKGRLGLWAKKTPVFDKTSKSFGLPFCRYNGLYGVEGEIWNVISGKRIVAQSWTFGDHFETTLEHLDAAGAPKNFLCRMRQFAAPSLACFPATRPVKLGRKYATMKSVCMFSPGH